ncbi:glycosyltransferase [Micromonospora purpureochromogenes]|uniref:glycosyltransferase n=1 Tax=Micromonospora purpureochromogenes TaxID=47872 RepID=UPI0033E2AA46
MTGRREWVAYVGPIRYPWGEAASRRVDGITRSLATAGHRVVVGSGQHAPAVLTELGDVEGSGSVAHVGLGELPSGGETLLAKSVQVLLRWGRRTVAWLDAQPQKPSHVILYGGGTPYAVHLRRWCRDNHVPLVVDVVEWYSPRQFAGGAVGPFYLGAQLALRHHYPRCAGVIAISRHLEESYRSRGSRVVRVPPTLDVRGIAVSDRSATADRTTLLYAGSPGKKDLLAEIIAAVDRTSRAGGDLTLQVLGPSPDEVRRLLRAEPPESVQVLGRVPQQDVSRAVREADFTVLLRPPARYAQAGFPTKFCESLANGTPVIANLTSDLELHLHDGVEGIVCLDPSVDALAGALRRAVALTGEERATMRKAAREQALDSFDFRAHAVPLAQFLATLQP